VSRDLVSPVLVGRRSELGRLRALLGRAMAGDPVVGLVAGEAGVGKTRLVQAFAGMASELGVRVLHGGCVDLGGEGIPLGPLVDVLRTLARSTRPRISTACSGRPGVSSRGCCPSLTRLF
jgi:predicted ATPase